QVRNAGIVEGNAPVSDNNGETIARGGDVTIKRWIDGQLDGKSCEVVLNRQCHRWAEMDQVRDREGVERPKRGSRSRSGNQSTRGRDPFDDLTMDRDGKKLSSIVK